MIGPLDLTEVHSNPKKMQRTIQGIAVGKEKKRKNAGDGKRKTHCKNTEQQ